MELAHKINSRNVEHYILLKQIRVLSALIRSEKSIKAGENVYKSEIGKGTPPGIHSPISQLILDTHQLVVFCHAIRT